MNPDTGKIYRGDEVEKALQREEPMVDLSKEEVKRLETRAQIERIKAGRQFKEQGRAYRRDPVTGLKKRI